MNEIEARVQWTDRSRFVGSVCKAQHRLVMDAGPEYGGSDDGPSPMQVLLLALGGCTATAVKEVLRAKHQRITGLEVVVQGTRAAEWPKEFTEIGLQYIVRGENVDARAVERAIELSEQKYCSVANSLKARVTSSYRILEEGQ